GLTKRGDILYTLIDSALSNDEKVITLLRERGPLRGAQIDHALPKSGWRSTLNPLIKQGAVQREAVLPTPEVKVRNVRTARLAIWHEQFPDIVANSKSKKQIDVLNLLADQAHSVDMSWITEQTGADSALIKRLADKGLVEIGEVERWRDPLAGRE